MLPTIIFATSNNHKLKEVQSILQSDIVIKSLKDIHYHEDIPEPYDTLEQNAHIKAQTIYDKYCQAVFSEDTGLFIEALDGEPGVKSARYAETKNSALNNVALVLNNMQAKTNRKAYFKTVLCCILGHQIAYFTGYSFGTISYEIKGESGFGYDGIFVPDFQSKSFGEMDLNTKNTYSHRREAVEKFATYLNTLK